MSNSSASVSIGGGIGFTGLLAILFITLKLTGHIAWSWLWVLSPIWISMGITLTFVLTFIIAIILTVLIFGR